MPKVELFSSIEEGNKVIPPGEKRLVKVGELEICVLNLKGEFKAVANGCPHLDFPLHKGVINPLGEIVCTWHHYRFNLNDGQELGMRCKPVKVYKIVVESEKVFLEV